MKKIVFSVLIVVAMTAQARPLPPSQPDSLLVQFEVFVDSLEHANKVYTKLEMAQFNKIYQDYLKKAEARKSNFCIEDKIHYKKLKSRYLLLKVSNKVEKTGRTVGKKTKNIVDKVKKEINNNE